MPSNKLIPVINDLSAGIANKTLTKALGYKHGSTLVTELQFSDGTITFIKWLQGNLEVGGTNEWGTGTKK